MPFVGDFSALALLCTPHALRCACARVSGDNRKIARPQPRRRLGAIPVNVAVLARRLNRRKSAQRTLLVSPDLTADKTSATGGCLRFVLPPLSIAGMKNLSQIFQ